jgi:peptide/nickel transport system substrate-binding protein
MLMHQSLRIIALIVVCATLGCTLPQRQNHSHSVNIAITTDPDALNPVSSKTVNGMAVNALLFQKLLEVDFESLELIPVLAQSLPEIEELNDSTLLVHYTIRPEAKWDNGNPVTATDVIFTLKTAILPLVNNAAHQSYLGFIRDITTDADDSQNLTFVCSPNLRILYSTGSEVAILPESVYDPKGVLRNIPFNIIAQKFDSLQNDPALIAFSESFNSEAFQRDTTFVQGSGAYALANWETGQKIALIRKDNWWGDELDEPNVYFESYPKKINWFIIKENAAMIAAARNGQLDAGPIVKSADFMELKKDSTFLKSFNCESVPELSTNVILINACRKPLASAKTRQALAHLFDANSYIESIQLSTGVRITGPLHPSKAEYNHQLQPYDFNLQKAVELLSEDGWSDTDTDGILDKLIDGKKVDLVLEYKYNTGNEGRKNAGLLFKDWAAQAGIEIKVTNEEWLIFIESLMTHNFDLAYFSWNDEYAPTDPTAVYHTSAIGEGYNFGCFGNSESDSLIEEISVSTDFESRKKLWFQLQEILHKEVGSIFISTNESRFFISNKLSGYTTGAVNPGFWPGSLKQPQP